GRGARAGTRIRLRAAGSDRRPRAFRAPPRAAALRRGGQALMEAAQQNEYRVEALARGLRILSAFSEQRPALPLKRIAELTGIPLPTAFRLVATLEAEGFVERLPSGEYQPGPAVLTLGFAALQGNDLVDTAQAPLRKLAKETGQSVNLGALHGD